MQQDQQQQQQQGGDHPPGPDQGPQSSLADLDAAAEALAVLLCAYESRAAPPYAGLAPALHAAFRHGLRHFAALTQGVSRHHCSTVIQDQQLLEEVMQGAEARWVPATEVLVNLAPQLFQQQLDDSASPSTSSQQMYTRFTALLAAGGQAGAALVLALMIKSSLLLARLPGAWEAACSGLRAACSQAAAAAEADDSLADLVVRGTFSSSGGTTGPGGSSSKPVIGGSTDPAVGGSSSGGSSSGLGDPFPLAVCACMVYVKELADAAGQFAADTLLPDSRLTGPLVPALGAGVQLLLGFKPPRQLSAEEAMKLCDIMSAAWEAMLSLSSRQETAAILGEVFQQQQGLCDRLAASWTCLPNDAAACGKAGDVTARLACALLLGGGVPGQEERRQHKGLLVAAVGLWDRVWPDYWKGRPAQLMEVMQLPHGPAAVARAGALLEQIFSEDVLGPDHPEGWLLLLGAPDFGAELVDGVRLGGETALLIVYEVWAQRVPAHCQALVAIPGLADALAECCRRDEDLPGVDDVLCELLYCEEGQAYLGQHPALLEALVTRLLLKKEYALPIWETLADWDGADDWLLQQPLLLEGMMRALVAADSTWDTNEVVERLRGDAPFMEALLRQPAAVEELLRVLVRRYCHPQPPGGPPAGDRSTQLMLVEGLAAPEVAPRALALLLGLLVKGDPELSAGVFEAMNLIQRTSDFTSVGAWGGELAAIAARAGPVQQADERLQALRQGREVVQSGAVAAAAVVHALQEQLRQAEAAAAVQAGGRDEAPEGSQQQNEGPKGWRRRVGQQQGQFNEGLHSHAALGTSGSSKQKGGCKRGAGQPAADDVGREQNEAGPLAPGTQPQGSAAAGAVGGGDQAAVAPPAAKRTKR
jgi:hypothetical protein